MNINEMVRILCVKRQTTVAQLSEKLGNSKQNLFMKLYRNDMKLSDIEKIAAALDCDLELRFIDKATKAPLV
ncbi:MAG: helix-turn-helix transcriptional regulator [Treponema sp.]|nr:helix-turn-helix transcriptional regulator [Treponema sp.]